MAIVFLALPKTRNITLILFAALLLSGFVQTCTIDNAKKTLPLKLEYPQTALTSTASILPSFLVAGVGGLDNHLAYTTGSLQSVTICLIRVDMRNHDYLPRRSAVITTPAMAGSCCRYLVHC